MRKEQFVEGEYYHIYNRGVDKRDIFLDEADFTRFLHILYLLNNFFTIPRLFSVQKLEPRTLLQPREQPLVRILAGCLMSNHYHLVVSPVVTSGISKFFHKVGVGYTMYFNKRRERTGGLFGGTFKAKYIDRQEYADYITHYIHMNPRDLSKTKSRSDVEEYPWSSLPEYFGGKGKFSLVLDPSFRQEVLGMTAEEYQKLFFEFFDSQSKIKA